jgi:PPOX class probable F420-dependent enzyme
MRKDGRPYVVPVWFDLEGETLAFTTWHKSIKAASIRRDPRVCLCMDYETPPFAYVQVEGTAVLSNAAEQLQYWARRIGGRYMGQALAEAYGKRNSVAGELLVRVTLTTMHGYKDVAG